MFEAVRVWVFLNIFRFFFHFSTLFLKLTKQLFSEIYTQSGSMLIKIDEQHRVLNENLVEL